MALGAPQDLADQDPGTLGMPTIQQLLKLGLKLTFVISYDCTGFKKQQMNTLAVNNPWTPKSAQLLRIYGLGMCDDGRGGTKRLMGPENLEYLNQMLTDPASACIECEVDGEAVAIEPEPLIVLDVSAVRHGEHLACSGWCGSNWE